MAEGFRSRENRIPSDLEPLKVPQQFQPVKRTTFLTAALSSLVFIFKNNVSSAGSDPSSCLGQFD